ncbi:isoflavone reductase [Coniochaeta ligniaria NRRL 30616]|uniref:Isoflavone reductase n=1 Tax=Coniochaeta ligniaria NRRL 30616 TaxID=1408157 RepID=A0A1J7JGC1_9PEZI|nr:isoflavone reductase [Coniochaeta ligniaria NRRL 30616]
MAIKTVAVVGASGNVGKAVAQALLDSGFAVTAITRPTSTSTFPSSISVRRADVTSVSDLTAALAGQDAVVAASATEFVVAGGQDPLIDAAVAAGVKRFVPGEFGHDLKRFERVPEGKTLGMLLGAKAKAAQYLVEKAEANPGFSWTGVGTSMFFDWGLDFGVLGVLAKERKATIFDSGDEVWSTSSLPFVGRAVAQALKHEEETKNKFVEVVEFQTTQNELVKAFEEELGAKFTVTHVKTADVEKEGQEKIAKGDYGGAFVGFLHLWAFTDGGNHAVPDSETANKLLGLPEPQKDVRAAVKEYVQSRGV